MADPRGASQRGLFISREGHRVSRGCVEVVQNRAIAASVSRFRFTPTKWSGRLAWRPFHPHQACTRRDIVVACPPVMYHRPGVDEVSHLRTYALEERVSRRRCEAKLQQSIQAAPASVRSVSVSPVVRQRVATDVLAVLTTRSQPTPGRRLAVIVVALMRLSTFRSLMPQTEHRHTFSCRVCSCRESTRTVPPHTPSAQTMPPLIRPKHADPPFRTGSVR
jgi:hypothetical protein